MGLKFFRIAAHESDDEEAELNRFLDTHRVISIDRRFVDLGANSYWAICAEYIPGIKIAQSIKKPRVDYKDVLTPDQFQRFVKLRELRRELAQQEAVPVYTLFTNEQLAAMVTQQIETVPQLANIDGVGQARMEKYGSAFVIALNETHDEASN